MNEEEKKGEIISMVEAKLPAGFRFHPRDDELICDYLMNTLLHCFPFFLHLHLNNFDPWDLPQTACVGGKEWYFYSQRDRKYATGLRTNRATATGYWKATGKDRSIHRKGTLVGMRKTLVFYKGRAPKGRKSDWVMHEFRLHGPSNDSPMEDWVLCRVFYKKREEAIKDNIRSCSLPPLMDSYINFDHSDQQEPSAYVTDDLIINEQVPCFSNPSLPMNPNPLFMDQAPAATMVTGLDTFCSDQRVLRALLNQLTKMDGDGEGSSQCLFTEVGIQTGAWN